MSANRRRQFGIALLALGWRVAPAQVKAGAVVRVGVLRSSGRPADGRSYYDAFFGELARAGWTEGRNLTIDWRFAEGDLDRHDALAAELVALQPDLILAGTQPGAVAAMKATRTIPILFVHAPDPVEVGLAESLSRPGRNVTGFASMNSDLVAKRLEFLRDALPRCQRVAALYQPQSAIGDRQIVLASEAAKSLGVELVRVPFSSPQTLDATFALLVRERPDGVLVFESPALFTHRRDVARRMAEARLPAMYGLQAFAISGGLAAYSIRLEDQYRRAAAYAARILRGEKPGDPPIQQPTQFELTVNLKAARELGLKLPQAILLRADRVVE